MRKMRYFRVLTAATLAATMVMGGTMNVMAAQSGDATTVESTGSYEGGEMKYPALSVTLPTVVAADYDYIADPNGLIRATTTESGDAAKYTDSQFQGDKGIYFLTTAKDAENPKNIYSERSAAKTVTNENAQNIDVTVKLEQGTTAGDSDIAYTESDTFTGTDKGLYLAVTDGASKTSALTSAKAAEVTATVPGNKDNYEPKYGGGYGYVKKTSGLGAWGDCSFYLTGALNMGAKWGDDVNFPSIKVTWSYKENTAPADAAPSVTQPATYSKSSGQDLVVNYSVGAGESGASALTDVLLQFDGSTYHSVKGTWGSVTTFASSFTISGNSITISKDYLAYVSNGTHTLSLIFDDDTETMITTTVTIQ